jgi:H+/Na+-translocating ferredoxin:NAD+ oxidoreductase subunit G
MAKRESTFINMVAALFLVTAIAATALGYVYELTKEPIAAAIAAKKQAAIEKVLPAFDTVMTFKVMPITGKDSIEFNVAYKDTLKIGTAIETYTDDGFSGRFKIMVGFLPDGTIHNTSLLEHKETPGLGDKMDAKKSDFPNQFMSKHPDNYKLIVTKDGGDVDAITAATISSRAFCDAVQRAYDALIKEGGNE